MKLNQDFISKLRKEFFGDKSWNSTWNSFFIDFSLKFIVDIGAPLALVLHNCTLILDSEFHRTSWFKILLKKTSLDILSQYACDPLKLLWVSEPLYACEPLKIQSWILWLLYAMWIRKSEYLKTWQPAERSPCSNKSKLALFFSFKTLSFSVLQRWERIEWW